MRCDICHEELPEYIMPHLSLRLPFRWVGGASIAHIREAVDCKIDICPLCAAKIKVKILEMQQEAEAHAYERGIEE